MAYELDTEKLVNYLYHRVHDPKFRGQKLIGISMAEDRKSLTLFTYRTLKDEVITHEHEDEILEDKIGDKIILRPSFIRGKGGDRIEIEIEPQKAGVNSSDVESFLDYLSNDRIFRRGQPLFSHEREEGLKYWTTVLERADDPKKHKLVCNIIDRKVGTKKLRKAIYEYMFKPCRYYLFHLGSS